ncbi:hypothetical protein G6F24_013127 [Rhizopus arrhizus]|nr:hypothetical protein G6F24_013127 [Rhizopus arrhizus]
MDAWYFSPKPGAGRARFRRDLQRAAAATADEGGDVLGVRSEQLVVGVELEAQADLRQHRFLRGQRARGDAGLHARVGGGAHAGVRALDADVHGQALVQEAHAVLHVELARADVEVLVEQQAVRVLQVQVVQERAADVVEVARDVMVVLLEPQAGFQLVDAHRPRQRGGEAIAVDGVVGAADRDRQHPVGTRVGRLARRPPVALATVVMMVGQQLQAALRAQAQVGIHRVQVVVTQRTALIVGVVDAADIAAEFARRSIEGTGRAIRGGHGAIPVRRVDVPVIAQAAGQHVLGQVGVVGLAGTRGRHERTEAVVADIPDRLGVELARGLVLVRRGPHVLVLVHAGHVGREAVDVAGIHAQVTTALVVVTHGDAGAAAELGGRIHREVLDGATQVAGRGYAQRTDALRQFGAGQVLGDDRAGDAQAVVVAVAVVAQRDAVQRVAEAALVEATQADRGRGSSGRWYPAAAPACRPR